jgi:RNA polymerase sigma-70 factor, ECF subfamily
VAKGIAPLPDVLFPRHGRRALDRNASDRNELFVELLTLHQRTLYGFIYTLVHNPADAEDLLQQTSLVLWQKFDEFDPDRNFSTWACGIAHFTVSDFLRKKRRSRVVFSDELIARLAEDRRNHDDQQFVDSVALAGCIEELSEIDRKLIRLCYSVKRDIKAAAAALGRPVASVYVSLTRVRRLLMDCLQRTNAEEVRT